MSSSKVIFCVIPICCGLIITSYIASILFFSLAHLNPDLAKPWSIWTYLPFIHLPMFRGKLIVSLAIPHLLLAAIIYRSFVKIVPEFGDARWCNWQDIKNTGLFSQSGMILGKYRGRYLISDTPTHAMLIAPTRSGKGVGLVIPNLLNWSDSLICLDIKHENYKKTAGYRQACGHEVFMWSPLDHNGKSHRYNPLDAVSSDPHQRISDIQVIAKILIRDPLKSDPIWASEARALFVGLALYVIENEEMPSTIGAINRLLGTEQDLGDVVRHIVQTHRELSSTIKKSLMNFANKAAKERSGVKSSLNQAINLWDNPVIDAATSHSDFTLTDLRKRKMAVYVGVLTGQIQTLAPLLRIFFEQVITNLSMKEPDDTEPYKILMMLDEFHMLGEMSSMTSAFTLLGGYNCRVMAVVQGLKWIDDVYGRDKRDGILSCCAHQIFFAANDLETAAYVMNSCGEKTVQTIATSRKHSMKYDAPSKNTSSRARPLISKEKVKQLPKNEEIIITEASFPVRARKIEYFKDANFKSRLLPAPSIPKLLIVDHQIPEFDIPAPDNGFRDIPDPNQMDIFKADKKPSGISLTSWLDEAADLRSGNNESDDISEILKILNEAVSS